VNLTRREGALGTSTRQQSALVFGGGLAGIAASKRLAEAGWKVTLLEARSSLGGRAFSYDDPGSGRKLDNGQHVIVGACQNLLAFLEAIDARKFWHLQNRLDVAVYDGSGRLGRLYGVPAPAPLYLLPAFIAYPHLGWLDKINAVRGLLSIMRAQRDDPALEDITFYDWLRASKQSEIAIANLWNVLIEGTLNDHVSSVSASMGLMIVQDGLLEGSQTANVGYPTVPLQQALGNPARSYLEKLGVSVVTGCAVRCVNTGSGHVVQNLSVADVGVMEADAYVSAVPFWILPKIVSGPLSEGPTFADLSKLQTSPIVNAHLLYDRPVMAGDFCYFLGSPLQWVFNSSRIFGAGEPEGPQSLSVSISAAWDYIDIERSRLTCRIASEMLRAFPKARDAELLDSTIVKQRNATFRCIPGANRHRPGPRTESPNLFLAGEWTDTGWPSTMEGAVISGYNAAEAVMSSGWPRSRSEERSAGSMV